MPPASADDNKRRHYIDKQYPDVVTLMEIMSSHTAQRIVLITGANRGIGLETARQLARRGFHVVIAPRDAAGGPQAVQAIRSAGGKADFLPLDVSSSASIHAAAGQFARIANHLDVLINNAGIY